MRSTRLTVMYNILFFIVGTIMAVAIAVMLGEITNKLFIKVSQSLMFLPYFISWMVIGAILYALLNAETGMVNQIVRHFGGEGYDYYVISGIDSSLYEAAKVDGASKWQCIRKITLPLLKPTVVVLFLLSVGNMLKGNLNMIIGLTNLNPVLLSTTDLIDVYVYRSGVRNGEMAFASAISLYQSVFGLILVVISNKIAGKVDPESTLF